ncbi:MAG: TldD/PmbA family protein [Candidatus Brockarchaeota archaeon]|nr:TldD/PmbA family protein [Candidatus Brockarchaeota archaeon]
MELSEVASAALRIAKRKGSSDAVSIARKVDWSMVKFANNGVTASKRARNTTLSLFAIVGGKRAFLTTTNLSENSVEGAFGKASKVARDKHGEAVPAIPRGPFKYPRKLRRIGDPRPNDEKLPDLVEAAIVAALSAGAGRVAGTLTSERTEKFLCTTGGAEGSFASTSYNLSVRAFADSEATGQFAQVATSISSLDAEGVGKRAGQTAKEAEDPRPAEPGRYDAVFGPMVVANLVGEVARSASGTDVDAGISFLTGMLGQRVASASFSLDDDPADEGAAGSAPFDDEGLPTYRKTVVENGVLRTYLHNSHTAGKMGAKSTANAGLARPRPFNLVVHQGGGSIEDLISKVDDGVYATNNWYLRYQDSRKGDFSTVLRDGLFKIEGGRIAGPIKGLRLSGNMLKLLNGIEAVGRERHWIAWWEVETPTLAPAILVRGADFTKPAV